MTAFFLHIYFRALSGAANASYYADRPKQTIAATALFYVSNVLTGFFGIPIPAFVLFCAAGFLSLGKYRAFDGHKTLGSSDIHLWENLTMVLIPVAIILSGGSLALTALGMYPGLFLHKMLINKGCGLPVFDDRTDDETGKTYGMALPLWLPIFGGEVVNVPRTTQKFRLYIAIGCTLAAVAFYFSPFYGENIWKLWFKIAL